MSASGYEYEIPDEHAASIARMADLRQTTLHQWLELAKTKSAACVTKLEEKFRDRQDKATAEWIWSGGLAQSQTESEQLTEWWAGVPAKTKVRHKTAIDLEKWQADSWMQKHDKELPGVDAGRDKDIVSFADFFDSFLAKSGVTEFDALDADADVDDVESEFADIAKTPDTPHWLGSKIQLEDLNTQPSLQVKAFVLLERLDALQNASKSDDTMSDAKLAQSIRKQWTSAARWDGAGDKTTLTQPHIGTGKIVLERLRIFLNAQKKAHRQLTFAEVAALPTPPLPTSYTYEQEFGVSRDVQDEILQKLRLTSEEQVRLAREYLETLYILPRSETTLSPP